MRAASKDDGLEPAESYPCDLVCGADMESRAALRCALPGFPEKRWHVCRERLYMGQTAATTQEEIACAVDRGERPERPSDDHEEGCPGSWYRCGFALSLGKYERLLTDSGFSANIMLERTRDRLVIEATQYLELHRMRKRQQDNEARYSRG